MSSSEVQLAIYDLSHGMARSLSAQFLGTTIEIVPHTGVLVFGREYYFGAGIQSTSSHQAFSQSTGLRPVQVVSVGRTAVSQSAFEAWCHDQRHGRYAPAAYDLLARNCNHFSHDALTQGLGLPQGVPQWILDIPQRFLQSPMGAALRPMLQNMQLANTVPGHAPAAAPFHAPAAAPVSNPWANLPATAPNPTPPPPQVPKKKKTTILRDNSKPLLANDRKTIPLCVRKIKAALDGDDDSNHDTAALDQLVLAASASANTTNSNNKLPTVDQPVAVCRCIHACLEGGRVTAFALMLLRVVLLFLSSSSSKPQDGENNDEAASSCLEWMMQQYTADDGFAPSLTSSARAMWWMCWANYITTSTATPNSTTIQSYVQTTLLDAALSDWQPVGQARPQVRQAASAFVLNQCLVTNKRKRRDSATTDHGEQEESLDEATTLLLCSAVEGLDDEPDATVQQRRLLVTGQVLQKSPAAVQLARDLGLSDALEAVTGSNRDLAQELIDLVLLQ